MLRPALLLIAAVLVVRMLYVSLWCPFSLVEDEAHYWDWSRHLDWSYYTKGPGIAVVIAASTRVLGHSEFAVRASMPLFGAVLMGAAALLAARGGGRRFSSLTLVDGRRALYAAGAAALIPVFQVMALLATIDGPYCACWAVAAVAGQRALMGRSTLSWGVLGLAIGAGFLFKYTILLLVPGLLLFVMTAGASRAVSKRWPLLLAAAVVLALAGMAPVVIWNVQNGWPTVAHLMGHLGFAEPSGKSAPAVVAAPGRGWSPLWTLEFVGTQIGFVGPMLVLAVVGVVRARRQVRGSGEVTAATEYAPAAWFMACCALPILAVYLVVSLITEPEGNWPVAAYVTLVPLAGIIAAEGMAEYRVKVLRWRAQPVAERGREGFLRRKPETLVQLAWHGSLAFGIGGAVLTGVISLLPRFASHLPDGIGKLVPLGRLTQGRDMADAAEKLRSELAIQSGQQPRIVAQHYGRASQLAFYLRGQPVVYCSNSRQGGRLTAQDFWADSNLDAAELRGAGFVIVGGNEMEWGPAFDTLVAKGLLAGVDRKGVHAFLGYGFRGVVPSVTSLPASATPSTRADPTKSPQ